MGMGNIGIEENLENLDIDQGNEKSQEGIFEKELQLEVVLHQLESQEHGGDNSSLSRDWKFVHNHPTIPIIRDPSKEVTTRRFIRNMCVNLVFYLK